MRNSPRLLISLVFLVAGCAVTPQNWRTHDQSIACTETYEAIDEAVDRAGTGDAEYARLEDFPYFRIDRFLASYTFAGFDAAQRTDWINRLVANDLEARAIEIGNLPSWAFDQLSARLADDPLAVATRCSAILRADDHRQTRAHQKLPQQARVADDYSDGKRAAGLYPVSALFVNMGFSGWKKENLGIFRAPAGDIPQEGNLHTYAPPSDIQITPTSVQAMIDSSRTGALGIPDPLGDAADALIKAFAPIWEIDTVSDDDRLGRPFWRHADSTTIAIDTGAATTYTRFSHAHWNGHVLLQINYMVWFPSRPPEDGSDPLAGHLDGIIWRVTIGADGRALVYDSIHPCGCYHLFFPGPGLTLKPEMQGSPYYEGTVVAASAPVLATGQRPAILLATRTHYIQSVSPWSGDADATSYLMADYHDLRAIPHGGAGNGSKSLFRPDGLIAGTERGERRWLWVTGIKSPGAMRQWGHHATAFVGKRHFDDPWLMMKNFDYVPPMPE